MPLRFTPRTIAPASRAAALLLLFAAGARADVILPSSAFSAGQNAAQFQSDVRIFNPTSAPVTVTPVFLQPDLATLTTTPFPAASFSVPARGQVAFDNVLSSLFGRPLGAFGPVVFQASAPIVVSSSVNNVNACGNGSISGQWLPGLDPLAEGLTKGTLVQLGTSATPSSGYRTNVVFFNPSPSGPASVTANVRKGDGTLLGVASITLPPQGWTQRAVNDGTFPGLGAPTDTNLFLDFTSDQPILSFASVINNASGDPFAIVAVGDPVAAPVAAYTVSSPATAGQPVTFTDTSTGGLVGARFWAFGDGSFTSGGASVPHTYAAAGTYKTALFVANAGGSSSATKDVTVASAGPTQITITATTTNGSLWTFTPNTVTLEVGKTYQITWQSNDVEHGVGGLALLGITQCNSVRQVAPCTVTITPTASQRRTYNYVCTQSSCGAGHNSMGGTLIVQ